MCPCGTAPSCVHLPSYGGSYCYPGSGFTYYYCNDPTAGYTTCSYDCYVAPPSPAAPPLPPFTPCQKAMDVVLVLDESGSMYWDMASMKVFAKDLVASFAPLGETSTKFGVVSFATDAKVRTGFTADAATIDTAIDAMVPQGWTSISDGLGAAAELFATEHREGATKIVLTLADGEQTIDCGTPSDCTGAAIAAATELKAQSVTIFSWGFGGVSTATLEALASGADKVKFASDLAGLSEFAQQLREDACAIELPPPTPPTPPSLPSWQRSATSR
jgi:uncharacterized protein YegL